MYFRIIKAKCLFHSASKILKHFQFIFENNAGLHGVFGLLCSGICIEKSRQHLVARVFPRFRQLGWFYSLAFNGIFLSSDWLS